MTSISKNVYIEKLGDIINKYNNTYSSTIKMKPINVKSSTYIDEDPKFKISGIVRISKYENIFAKSYFPNWSEEVSVIKKVKNTVLWTYVFSDLKGEEIVGSFYKIKSQKANQKDFRAEKVIKRKGDKLYVKWKGYNSSFNSWIDKNTLYK